VCVRACAQLFVCTSACLCVCVCCVCVCVCVLCVCVCVCVCAHKHAYAHCTHNIYPPHSQGCCDQRGQWPHPHRRQAVRHPPHTVSHSPPHSHRLPAAVRHRHRRWLRVQRWQRCRGCGRCCPGRRRVSGQQACWCCLLWLALGSAQRTPCWGCCCCRHLCV
jgi:hypothetical protein